MSLRRYIWNRSHRDHRLSTRSDPPSGDRADECVAAAAGTTELAFEISSRRRNRILQLSASSAAILILSRHPIALRKLQEALDDSPFRIRDMEKAVAIGEAQGLLEVFRPALCQALAR